MLCLMNTSTGDLIIQYIVCYKLQKFKTTFDNKWSLLQIIFAALCYDAITKASGQSLYTCQ